MSGSPDDRDLGTAMASAQAGDEAAYRRLLQACIPPIRAVARANGVPVDTVDDVVQDCLIAVHGARHTYDPARPFLPWLHAIARRRAIDALRRGGRMLRREISDPLAYETAPDPVADPSRGVEASERKRLIDTALRKLPPAQREAVEQLAIGERSLAEAAAVTGRSTGSLKVNLHRALANLRARFGTEPDRDA